MQKNLFAKIPHIYFKTFVTFDTYHIYIYMYIHIIHTQSTASTKGCGKTRNKKTHKNLQQSQLAVQDETPLSKSGRRPEIDHHY